MLALLSCGCAPIASAHNPDTSYLRVDIDAARLRTRLTCDLVTLGKVVALDDDGDRRISRQELDRHLPEIAAFFAANLDVEMTDHAPGLGGLVGVVWPTEMGESIGEKDYHSAAALISLRFERPLDDAPEDVSVDFRIFGRLGERHTVVGSFVCGADVTEVTFSRFEPDYEYVTGLRPSPWRRAWRSFWRVFWHGW